MKYVYIENRKAIWTELYNILCTYQYNVKKVKSFLKILLMTFINYCFANMKYSYYVVLNKVQLLSFLILFMNLQHEHKSICTLII